ncbi:hypothetical protein APA02_33710 [Pseudomonas aeruginosa]|nr:hypothetical protein EGY23_07040 [Pseudomonas aeruginosa]KSJ80075.2 hypothetical protein APA02_33710 [Pseudomonas aeruginosa]OWJ42429.1 hypothetical protein CDC02_07750 [Pseudomonas aeruginosa]RPR46629.1 hypothetical protein IPC1048_32525 [Pseudomonas aeruginosa]
MGDHGLALFLEQFDQALLLFDQSVDAGGFVVEKAGDLGLFRLWRLSEKQATKIILTKILHACAGSRTSHLYLLSVLPRLGEVEKKLRRMICQEINLPESVWQENSIWSFGN